MPINDISLRKIDTQKLFDFVLDFENYKKLKDGHGVYCLFHKKSRSFVPLYVGSSTQLKIRATRFFRSQNNSGSNEYVTAIIKHLGNKQITVGVKFVDCLTPSELLIWEKIYQEQLKPILNHSTANDDTLNLGCMRYFVDKSGLQWGDYVKKYIHSNK